MGASSDAGGPGGNLHHHGDNRAEGVGQQSQLTRRLQEAAGVGLCWDGVNINPRRRRQSPGAPDGLCSSVGSRNTVASASDAPAALHRVQVSHTSLTELLFLFSWGKIHFNISSCCVAGFFCNQTGV